MEPEKDYYEILQVHEMAEPEVIEAAYKKLAQKYHPDHAGDMVKMREINMAHDVLSDSLKRRDYDSKRRHKTAGAGTRASPPKPTVDPYHIEFTNVMPGQVKKASFTVFNTGGPYSKINISNPDSWLKVSAWHSLASTDELPLKVEVEAMGRDWNKRYSEVICINLDNIQSKVNVVLSTRTRFEIKDHRWHDIEYSDLKAWIKRRRNALDTGQEMKGKTFSYRFNLITKKYQVRLRHNYSSAIYDPGQ